MYYTRIDSKFIRNKVNSFYGKIYAKFLPKKSNFNVNSIKRNTIYINNNWIILGTYCFNNTTSNYIFLSKKTKDFIFLGKKKIIYALSKNVLEEYEKDLSNFKKFIYGSLKYEIY